MDLFLSAVFVLALVAANLWMSVRVIRDELLSKQQRGAQLGLIWLLPVLGVLVVLMFRPSDAIYVSQLRRSDTDVTGTGVDPSFYRDQSAAWDGSHRSPSGEASDSSQQ